MSARLDALLGDVRACRLCEAHLPLGPRPVVQASPSARLLIVGQAPGTRVHASGIPWADGSGNRLRDWLQVDPGTFYDPTQVAIVPMGFCYPGRKGSGDAPPRPECARTWHPHLLPLLPHVELTLLVGRYAQEGMLGDRAGATLTDTMHAWREYLPRMFPLPHPSPRNIAWFKHNPWFEDEVVPALRARIREVLR